MASSSAGSGASPHPEPPGKIHATDVTRPFKQDLPPKGGYAPINFKRIPAKQIVNGNVENRAFVTCPSCSHMFDGGNLDL